VHIVIHNRQIDLKIPAKSLKLGIAKFLAHKKSLCAEVVIHYVTKKEIAKLHEQFFGDPTPTDCISVPIDAPDDDSPHSILGEVFVCPKVAIEYTQEHGGAAQEETLLYTLHGLLHLLGFDDQTAKDRKIMRREEQKALVFFS
jgi:probable rRNA maturation factor